MLKIIKILKDPKLIMLHLLRLKVSRKISDELYYKIKYRFTTNKKLNLENPQLFNEKLQWLKLKDRNPLYKNLVDKYEVRKHIAKTIGENYLIPLLGVYNNFNDIDFDSLPNQFVLKPNHTSGNVFICRDKNRIDLSALKLEIEAWLARDYYWVHREWPYKGIEPKIICEKYMVDESGTELKDYKVFCFNGVPKMIQVDFNRFNGHKRNLYDLEWNYIPSSIQYPSDSETKIKKPDNLMELLELSRVLSKGIPHVRTDFYVVNNNIYFGELTFYHGSGYEKFEHESLALKMGSWIQLDRTSTLRE